MPWNEKDLKKDLAGGLRPVYVLYGEESYICAQYTTRLATTAVPDDFGGFNLQTFDADSASLEQMIEAAEALPLMAERKCVVIRDLDVTAGDTLERLMPLIEDPSPMTVLVFSYLHFQPQRSAKWTAFFKAVEKVGAVVQFMKRTGTEMAAILCAGAARRGCVLSAQNAALLVQQCGDDLVLLGNELDKLAALADGGEITAKLIETVATRNLEAKIFDLSKAILQHRGDQAYEILHTLLQQKEKPVVILATLTNAYVDMYRAKAAQPHGGADTVTRAFPTSYKNKEFRMRYAARDAASLSMPKIYRALEILAQADTALKSTRRSPAVVLEQTLAQLL